MMNEDARVGFALVMSHVRRERERQDEKWGDQSDHPAWIWNAILGEEVGEVSEELLEYKFGDHDMDDVYKELIQVAAVAMAWADAINRDRKSTRLN